MRAQNISQANILLLALVILISSSSHFLIQTVSAAALPIGVVDFIYLINNHPETPKANAALAMEQEQARKEFETKSTGMNDRDKQALDMQLGQRVEQKRQELLKGITESVNEAMKSVADVRGLSLVLHKDGVALGGIDITQEVMQKVSGK